MTGKTLENFEIARHPKIPELSTRTVPFGKHLYIERDDFFDTEGPQGEKGSPPKGFKRLKPNGMVRLKFAYVIECKEIIRDKDTNEPIELICELYPETRAGVTPEGMKRVPGIIHWVEASAAVKVKINQYDRLFQDDEPGKERDYLDDLNPKSLETIDPAYVEPSVAMDALHMMAQLRHMKNDEHLSTDERQLYPSDLSYQFERIGYFALDKDSDTSQLIFNRAVTLRDSWLPAKKQTNTADSDQPQRRRGGVKNNQGSSQPLDDIRRVALRAGTILTAEAHPEADSLLVLSVDCGDKNENGDAEGPRTVVAGLAGKIPPEELIQKKVVCLTNLKPSKMRGIVSEAMLLAAATRSDDDDEKVQLLPVPDSTPDGELLTFENIEIPEPDAMLKSKGALKVWDRVKADLKTNADGEVVYTKDGKECKIITSEGTGIKTTFPNALIG